MVMVPDGHRVNAVAILLATLLLISMGACGFFDGTERDGVPKIGTNVAAEDLVAMWLTRASSDTGDRGWDLLHPLTQSRIYGDDSRTYVETVMALEWDDLAWSVTDRTSWDSNYLVVVRVTAEDNPDAVEALLDRLEQDHLVQRLPGEIAVTVRIDAGGDAGILGP